MTEILSCDTPGKSSIISFRYFTGFHTVIREKNDSFRSPFFDTAGKNHFSP